jgi:hypothetical protein
VSRPGPVRARCRLLAQGSVGRMVAPDGRPRYRRSGKTPTRAARTAGTGPARCRLPQRCGGGGPRSTSPASSLLASLAATPGGWRDQPPLTPRLSSATIATTQRPSTVPDHGYGSRPRPPELRQAPAPPAERALLSGLPVRLRLWPPSAWFGPPGTRRKVDTTTCCALGWPRTSPGWAPSPCRRGRPSCAEVPTRRGRAGRRTRRGCLYASRGGGSCGPIARLLPTPPNVNRNSRSTSKVGRPSRARSHRAGPCPIKIVKTD